MDLHLDPSRDPVPAPGPASGPAPRVVLYGRAGCHLCDLAREQVARVAGRAGAGWVEVDVGTDPELTARYSDLVPVVTVDGRHHGHWRIDEAQLAAALGSP